MTFTDVAECLAVIGFLLAIMAIILTAGNTTPEYLERLMQFVKRNERPHFARQAFVLSASASNWLFGDQLLSIRAMGLSVVFSIVAFAAFL